MSDAELDAVLAVNLSAVLRTLRDAPRLVRDEGRVVLLSSIIARAGGVGQTHYGATKAALAAAVQPYASLLAARGITVNAVAPGYIDTDMTRKIPLLPRLVGQRANALLQPGTPDDVASAVTFLASAAPAVNANVLRVCGGHFFGE
jgi:3-oxoacyl-[acyl-carrier protein] reductase